MSADDAIPDVESEAAGGPQTTTESVGDPESWAVGTMKMKKVGDHRVAVARTESGFHAVDNACPHQGYGLATGTLDGELLTCQWHNWKFDVRTGHCVRGEEDVACHAVDVVDSEVRVTVTAPSIAEQRQRLWPSLRRGIDADYPGQIARDSLRLLTTGVSPAEVMWAGLEDTVARTEDGIGHLGNASRIRPFGLEHHEGGTTHGLHAAHDECVSLTGRDGV